MNKYNTLLGQLSFVSRPQFEKLVKITQADKHCKGFTAWQQFVTMCSACESYAKKITETAICLKNCSTEFLRL